MRVRRASTVGAACAATVRVVSVHRLDPAAGRFREVIDAMTGARTRPELEWEEIPAPLRMAPHAFACNGSIMLHDSELASGRLVVLFNPEGDEAWEGSYRCVAFVQAQLEPEFAVESMLGDVAWSWVTEALELHGADAVQLGCTATRVVSQSYGALASRPSTVDVEMRVSWTPLHEDLAPHFAAWSAMLAAAGGLPPAPPDVAPIAPAHRAHAPRMAGADC